MMDTELNQALARSVPRSELILHSSERRLLLFVGDTLMIALAGGLALWLHSILH